MPIIDIHPHVIATDNVRYPLQPLGGNQSTWSRDRPTTYDTMIKEMDNAGVAKSAIVQASTAYGHDDSYVAEAIAAHPRRLTGVFSVDMLAPDNVEKMKHWLGRGFSGMRLFTTGSTMPGQATWFDDPRTFPAWQHARDDRHARLHADDPAGLSTVARSDRRFPKVKIILDHLARPQLTDGPPFTADQEFFALSRFRTSFSSSRRSTSSRNWGKATPESFFGALIAAFGANRLPDDVHEEASRPLPALTLTRRSLLHAAAVTVRRRRSPGYVRGRHRRRPPRPGICCGRRTPGSWGQLLDRIGRSAAAVRGRPGGRGGRQVARRAARTPSYSRSPVRSTRRSRGHHALRHASRARQLRAVRLRGRAAAVRAGASRP